MLHVSLMYEFRVNFCILMIILKQYDYYPRFHDGNFRTCADLESRAMSTSEIVCYVASSNQAKFDAFFPKVNN